jgi:hypothetical protein
MYYNANNENRSLVEVFHLNQFLPLKYLCDEEPITGGNRVHCSREVHEVALPCYQFNMNAVK